jgi:Ca2+-binding EF-hand superfamily protein
MEDVSRVVVQSLFCKYDTDKSGSLQKAELMVLLKEDMGMNSEQAEEVIKVVDKDVSGDVSFEEFFQWWTRDGVKSADDSSKCRQFIRVVEGFHKLDKDGSRTIDPDELKELLKSIQFKISIESAMEILDKDGDGVISLSEFVEFFSKVAPTK